MNDSNTKSYIKVSGAVGLKILSNKNTNKKIYLFYDDHSNILYCNKNNLINQNNLVTQNNLINQEPNRNIDLTELFEAIKLINDPIFLLEEPFGTYQNDLEGKVKQLWNDSDHVIKSRSFYKKYFDKCENKLLCKIFPIDVRLSLYDVSIEEIYLNLNNDSYFSDYDPSVLKYFYPMLKLFDLIPNQIYNTFDITTNTNYINLKKVFDIFKDSDIYLKLKQRVIEFNRKFIEPSVIKKLRKLLRENINKNNYNLSDFKFVKGFPYITVESDNIIENWDYILNSIMEIYAIFLINYTDNPYLIVNCGFFHCENIDYLLENYYSFVPEYDTGITHDVTNQDGKISNCLLIDKKFLL